MSVASFALIVLVTLLLARNVLWRGIKRDDADMMTLVVCVIVFITTLAVTG